MGLNYASAGPLTTVPGAGGRNWHIALVGGNTSPHGIEIDAGQL